AAAVVLLPARLRCSGACSGDPSIHPGPSDPSPSHPMAAILHSSIGKTARHAFSLEGALSAHLPRPRRRLLQTLQTADSTTHSQVDPLVRRIDEVARSAVLAEYAQGGFDEATKKGYQESARKGLKA
ncbi:unnamed protein product, partial [Urochloa humidicola]